MLPDPPPPDRSPKRDWSLAPIALLGTAAVVAWLAMLWFMFGDVM